MERKMKRTIWIAAAIVAAALAAYFVIPVSVPLILAFVTASLFEPTIRWGSRRLSLKRSWMVTLVYTAFLGVVSFVIYVFVSKGITQLIHVAERVPHYTWAFLNRWEEWNESILSAAEELPVQMVEEIQKQLDGFLFSITEPLRTFDYLKLATRVGTRLPLFLISVVVYLIAVFLFMLEMPRLIHGFYSHLKEETARKFRFMADRLSSVVWGFIKAQFLVSVVIFAASLIGLLFIAPRIALVMALIIWLIDLIPIIGSIAVVGPWAVLEFIQGNSYTGVALLILAAVLMIIRRTLEPKVMGQYIGLSPLATLISMYLGFQLIGAAGLLLGPLLLIAYRTAREAKLIKTDFKI